MPMKPKRPCRHPGCTNFSDEPYCEIHRKQVARIDGRLADAHRASARERGYTSAWEKARAAFLAKHPTCAECQRQGIVTVATVVDHIIPHRGDKKLFWDSENWQSLCATCHNQKTGRGE